MNASEEESRKSTRKIHIIGAVCIWFLIYMSPSLGSAFLEMPLGLTGIWNVIPIESVDALHRSLWEPIWKSAGYWYYSARSFGVPTCRINEDSSAIILVSLLYGVGIGAAGALFQAAAMRHRNGHVKAKTLWSMMILWGSIFALMSVGSLMLFWVDSWGGCDMTFLFQLVWYTNMLYMLVVPVPLLLLFGAARNARLWQRETPPGDESRPTVVILRRP